MSDMRKVWIPSDSNLSREEKSVLGLSVSQTQQVSDPYLLRSLMERKLVRLMNQEEDQDSVMDLLAGVPDLYLAAQFQDNNRDRATAMLEESSLSELVNRVNLEAQSDKMTPETLELTKAHKEQSLSSLLSDLAISLE